MTRIRTILLTAALIALVLALWVLLFTDRGGFAWTLAACGLAGVVAGDVIFGISRRRRADQPS